MRGCGAETGQVNQGAAEEAAFKETEGLVPQVGAPGVGLRMGGRLQTIVWCPSDQFSSCPSTAQRPIGGAAFQIIAPGRLRRAAGRESVERVGVVIHRSIAGVIAADNLVIVIPVSLQAAQSDGVVGDERAGIGGAPQQDRFAVLDQRVRRLGGEPAYGGIAKPVTAKTLVMAGGVVSIVAVVTTLLPFDASK